MIVASAKPKPKSLTPQNKGWGYVKYSVQKNTRDCSQFR